MSATAIDGLSPLATDLQAQDPDRYLSTLFASSSLRPALFALYAFDHEIAKIRRVVREPMAGLIRLQWWRDALDAIGKGEVLAHPVVEGLSEACLGHDLDRQLLLTAIDARERDWDETPPRDCEALEHHLSAANGSIVKAAATLIGHHEPELLRIADQIGVGLGLLERLTWLAAEPTEDPPPCTPGSLLLEHGLIDSGTGGQGQPDLADRDEIDKIRQILRRRAQHHLSMARQGHFKVPRQLLPAFFPGTLAEIRLRNLDRSRNHPVLATAPYRLLWHWLCGRF